MQINEKPEEKKEYESRVNYIKLFNQGISGLETNKELFLSKFFEEREPEFEQRFLRSRLSNYVNKSYEQIKGHLLQSTVSYNEDELKKYPNLFKALENMDGKGTNIKDFLSNLISKVLIEGSIPFIIDFDRFDGLNTKENSEQAVPKFLLVDNANFINMTKNEGNLDKELSSFIFHENKINGTTLDIQNAEITQEINSDIFVYYKRSLINEETKQPTGEQRVFLARFIEETVISDEESGENKDNKKYVFVEEMPINSSQVPVEFINFNKKDSTSMFLENPPLYDLARLNGCLFRNESSQTEILRTSRFAIFAATGTKNPAPQGIAPNQWLQAPEKEAKYYVVEISGRAINAGKEDVEIAKRTLEDIQLDFLNSQNNTEADKTATESIINQNNSLSKIELYAQEVERFLNAIFNIAAKWTNQNEENIDFEFKLKLEDVSFINASNKDLLLKSFQNGAISKLSYLEQLKSYKVLDESFDVEKEILLIKEEEIEPDSNMTEMTDKNGQKVS